MYIWKCYKENLNIAIQEELNSNYGGSWWKMNIYEYCKKNNLTVNEARCQAQKNDEKYMKAYSIFKRPVYQSLKGKSHEQNRRTNK